MTEPLQRTRREGPLQIERRDQARSPRWKRVNESASRWSCELDAIVGQQTTTHSSGWSLNAEEDRTGRLGCKANVPNNDVGDIEESTPLCRVPSLSTRKDRSFSSTEAFADDEIPQATRHMVALRITTKVVTVERAL